MLGLHHKWCDHTTDECKVLKAMYEKHAPTKNFQHQKKAHNMHMIDEASQKYSKNFLESEECFAILKKQIQKINNPLFKAMKSEIRDELFMINEDDERKLTNKELKEMQTGLKLNKDTSNVEMDEDTDNDDY